MFYITIAIKWKKHMIAFQHSRSFPRVIGLLVLGYITIVTINLKFRFGSLSQDRYIEALVKKASDPRIHLSIPAGLPQLPYGRDPWSPYKETSRFLDGDFWKDGHNTDCGRVLFHTTIHNAGLGSQLNNMLLGAAEAMATGRAFALGNDILIGGYQCKTQLSGSKYQSCFYWTVVGPSSCDVDALQEEARQEAQFLPQYSLDCSSPEECVETEESRHQPKVRTPYDIEDIRATSVKRTKEGASGPIIGGRQLDWLALKAYIANQLWIFTPNTRQDVDQRIQTLDTFLVDREQGSRRGSDHHGIIRPFCSVHIRRGDKVGSEAREVPIHTYLDAFKKLNVSCRSYFLASDEICNVKPEFEKELRRRLALHEQPPIISTLDYSSQGEPYGNGGYRWGSFLAKQEDCRVQDTIDMLAELEVIRTSDAFVGAYSSNVARLAIVLRAATGWGPETSRSVEGQHWDWL